MMQIMNGDQLFAQLLIEDAARIWETAVYEFSDLFLNPNAIAIYVVLILFKLITWHNKTTSK
jgi:hypothetical protein